MTINTKLAICLVAALSAGPAFANMPAAFAAHPAFAAEKVATDPLLDINSASKADLMSLKGVGDKRADDIIKGRPYKGKDDLVGKKIVSKSVYDGIKDKIIAKQK